MITKAEYMGEYRLKVWFDDGQMRLIDLKHFLETTPVKLAKPFLDLERFKEVRVEDGTVCWGDNEMDINPLSIYYGDFEAADSPFIADIKAARRARASTKRGRKRQMA